MRYYAITIRDKDTGEVIRPRAFAGLKLQETYTSYVKGQSLPGALNVEWNIPIYNYATPISGSWVRIWGVSLEEISQANDLAGASITIRGGMKKGLPLAKPAQSGVIMEGTIFQAFGNWIGTDMTLELQLQPPTGIGSKPLNFTFNWRQQTPMEDMIRTTLQSAMPGFEIKVAISDQLVMSSNQYGAYTKLEDFAKAINRLSLASQFKGIKPLGGGPYGGVQISISANTVTAYDNTKDFSKSTYDSPKQIAFEDLIGQPTWITPQDINFKCPTRADLSVGDFIKMPDKLTTPYIITTQQASIPGTPNKNKSAFKGKFVIRSMQHFANFRQPDAASWVTSFVATYAPQSGSTEGTSPNA